MTDDLTPPHWNGDDIDTVIERMQSHNDVPVSAIADAITALRAERDAALAKCFQLIEIAKTAQGLVDQTQRQVDALLPLPDAAYARGALVEAVQEYKDRSDDYFSLATDRGGHSGPKGKAFIAMGEAYKAMTAALALAKGEKP